MNDGADLLLIADFTIDNLAARIRKRAGLSVAVAPFDRVEPVLLGHETGVWTPPPRAALVWTRPERMIPAFGQRMAYEPVQLETILEEVEGFAAALVRAAERVGALFVATWTLPPTERGLGILDMDPGRGLAGALLAMNRRLTELLAGSPRIHVLDAQRWVAETGRGACSPKLWYLSKTPFAAAVFDAAERDLRSARAALRGETRKLLVVDLDDTIWGGLVGEEGWENLRLGGHDPIGEALADFQRALRALTRRGILLGIVSKNDEAIALEAIRRHPEMVLGEDDFAGWRINWLDKAANIAELTAELNLGLQSVVFIDDHPHERARVRDALPEVLVPEWPRDKLLYPAALQELTCFDTAALTGEDRERGRMYAAERRRRDLQREVPSVEEWLAGLGIRVTVEPYTSANARRVAQLINKTNQMNLRTRRLSEAALADWVVTSGRHIWAFRVSDRFGDSGLCGVVSVDLNGEPAQVTDFVLSCRVFGRSIERVMIRTAADAARRAGKKTLEACYRPTAKNRPCREFLDASGLHRNGDRYLWNPDQQYPVPDYLTVIERSEVAAGKPSSGGEGECPHEPPG